MPPKAQTDSLTTVKLSLNHLLDLALTKRTISLGGKLTTQREDIASAIRIIELTLRVQELETPPLDRLLALLNEAPSYIVNAWLQVNKYLYQGRAYEAQAKQARSQQTLEIPKEPTP